MPIKVSLIPPIKIEMLTDIVSGGGGTPVPPVTFEAHGDVSSLGYLGRTGVAERA